MRITLLSSVCLAIMVLFSGSAFAKDNKILQPIAAAPANKDAQDKLQGGVTFFYGSQEHPKVLKTSGTDVANRKTKDP